VFENRVISIPGLKGHEAKEISEKNLALIIQARVEEILDYVVWEIRRSGYENKLIGGLVLTGGGALLEHVEKLAAYHTGFSTRIGMPIEHLAHGYNEKVCSPIYATAIGLLINGIKSVESGKVVYKKVQVEVPVTVDAIVEEEEETNPEDAKWYEKLFNKTKEWFEADKDTEF
jgi:cell division protein FtsA